MKTLAEKLTRSWILPFIPTQIVIPTKESVAELSSIFTAKFFNGTFCVAASSDDDQAVLKAERFEYCVIKERNPHLETCVESEGSRSSTFWVCING